MTAAELSDIAAATDDARHYARRATIRDEGTAAAGIYVLTEGWAAASMTLRNGGRQFFKVHIPGDVLGAPSLASDTAVESLTALTDCTVRSISTVALGKLLERHPRIAASLFLSANKERIALMDALAMIGRLSGVDRIVSFFLDLHDRLVVAEQSADGTIFLPITQEEIGDLLGMTPVHVNRMIKTLEGRQLVRRNGRGYTIDARGLRDISQLPTRSYVREPTWLPPATA